MPSGIYSRLSLRERFLDKISPEPNTGCWLWTGQIASNGYACLYANGGPKGAHRIAYELEIGNIPQGMVIDHICRIRSCVNPRHLRIVTCRENLLALGSKAYALINAAKTHCVNGHEFNGNNLVIRRGKRCCRACERRWCAERRQRIKDNSLAS